jgi:hypothetical protein
VCSNQVLEFLSEHIDEVACWFYPSLRTFEKTIHDGKVHDGKADDIY